MAVEPQKIRFWKKDSQTEENSDEKQLEIQRTMKDRQLQCDARTETQQKHF